MTIRYGTKQYFDTLIAQIDSLFAPQLAAGALTPAQARDYKAQAMHKAYKQVRKFYGLGNKYDGSGRLKAA